MLKKMTVALFSVLFVIAFFTACTDDSDPVVPVDTPDASILLAAEEIIDATAALEFKVDVSTATRMKIYWVELGSDDNAGETADIQVSVLKMDGTTPYKIISNNKDFLQKDNSSSDDTKEVYVDTVEDSLIVRVEQNTIPGTFKLIVQKNPMIFSTNDSLLTAVELRDYEVIVKNADKVAVYWQEITTTEEGNDKIANVQGSVYRIDLVTPYLQIENGKDFEDKDNSSWDSYKEILLDKGENFINVRIEVCEDFLDATGTFAIYVLDTSDEE